MPIHLVAKDRIADDPAAELVVGGDDYSIRVESKLDPRLWVRIERETGGGVVVTDFTAGSRPESELKAALLLGFDALMAPEFSRVVFRDLVPAGDQVEGFPIKVIQSADLAKRLAAALGEATGRAVKSFTMEPRRGKLDAIVVFGEGSGTK